MRISFFKPKKIVTLFIVAIKLNQNPPSNADDFLMDRMNSKRATACQLINTIQTIILNLVYAHKHKLKQTNFNTSFVHTTHTHTYTQFGLEYVQPNFIFILFISNKHSNFLTQIITYSKVNREHLDQKSILDPDFAK